jgi:glycosyltransferase involved in cell wall biosynthesis
MFRLISFVSEQDREILPHFLDHYRSLGVGEFRVLLHGRWTGAAMHSLRANDVMITGFRQGLHSDQLKWSLLAEEIRTLVGEWLVVADPNEFLGLPFVSLKRTVSALTCMGIEELPCNPLHWPAASGENSSAPEDARPLVDAEAASGVAGAAGSPESKSNVRYPLFRVGPHFTFARGTMLPQTGRPTAHVAVRGVLLEAGRHNGPLASAPPDARSGREDAHSLQMASAPTGDFRTLLEDRPKLFAAGLVVRPTPRQIRHFAALRRLTHDAATQGRPSRNGRRLPWSASAAPQRDVPALESIDKTWLNCRPGRVAVVTMELLGFYRNGGIGTGMSAVAERLLAAGHSVDILFCPHQGEEEPDPYWLDYWRALGATIRYLPRRRGKERYPSGEEFSWRIAMEMQAGEYDVIHFHDNCGYAAATLLLRAAGLAFHSTRMVVTAHGSSRWHRIGNLLPWSENEAVNAHLEAISLRFSDVVACPNDYMMEWSRKYHPSDAPHVLLPNVLPGESMRFKAPRERRQVKKIIFFGRIEVRKGIDAFLEAIELLLKTGRHDFEVVLLGRVGESMSLTDLYRRTAAWNCRSRVISNYSNHEAIDFLRREECIVVMPSRVDNSPFAICECLENGIPFIASDVGGIPELLPEDERSRILVHGGAGGYANKLMDLLENGATPVAPRFSAEDVDADWLALNGRLVSEARRFRERRAPISTTTISVIAYGPAARRPPKPLKAILREWMDDGAEVLWSPDFAAVGSEGPEPNRGAILNRAARSAAADALLFLHTDVEPELLAFSALRGALENCEADAVVCGYATVSLDGASTFFPVVAGPPEFSPDRNVYGADILLVRRSSFLAVDGFSEDFEMAQVIGWDLLNRMLAAGLRVVAVPSCLARTRAARPAAPTKHQRMRLAAPWIDGAPPELARIVRMALFRADATPNWRS